ncbi:uncharacterized protein LOC62_02G003097 [Vanrija pseudolonga]|uniref:AMP-dependent synthetase/ligase domain-containing protein n=1 Tax=Vanrija pseudolonga TaxID=143232 RepID=A0AAF0Y552_9TREE|nr:hypothetical protein LOC62_02G003097 [Vanrija pseudolonga]
MTPPQTWPPPPPLRTLDDILASAATHPVYAPLLAPTPAEQHTTLGAFPLLTKSHLIATVPELLVPPCLTSTYLSPTGGTRTGPRPLFVPTDTSDNRIQRYLYAQLLRATGTLGPESVVLNLHGGMPMYRSGDLTSSMIDYAGGTELACGVHASMAQAMEYAGQFGANTVSAADSKLVQLATWADEHPDQAHNFHTALFTSEPLSRKQEAFVRRALGVRAIGSVYGSAECGPVAVAPPTTAAGEETRTFVVDRRMFVVEVVSDGSKVLASSLDSDPAPHPVGEVVLTSLVRHRNPIVRYRTGDYGVIRAHASSPELVYVELHGRDKELSFSLATDYIDVSKIEAIMARYAVIQWQVVLSAGESVEFRAVFDSDGGRHNVQERADAVRSEIRTHILGDDIPVAVNAVGYDELEKGSMARKLRKVVDNR